MGLVQQTNGGLPCPSFPAPPPALTLQHLLPLRPAPVTPHTHTANRTGQKCSGVSPHPPEETLARILTEHKHPSGGMTQTCPRFPEISGGSSLSRSQCQLTTEWTLSWLCLSPPHLSFPAGAPWGHLPNQHLHSSLHVGASVQDNFLPSPQAHSGTHRAEPMTTIAPYWIVSETWLCPGLILLREK